MNKRVDTIIKNLGFDAINPLQRAMVESNVTNRVLLSATGSGKTVAFLLPAIELCDKDPEKRVLIIAPSRELALQIESVLRAMKSDYSVTCCYGGHSIHIEKRSLEYTPQFIIGTPGRLLDHIEHNNIDPQSIGTIIFDEFDKLLELGFCEEMEAIVSKLPFITNRTLTSATQSVEIPPFVEMGEDYQILDFLPHGASGELSIKRVDVKESDKLETLFSLICMHQNDPTIVFCNYRESAEEISDFLYDHYIENEFFHGGMEQFDRERSLAKFRNGSCTVLVSTDLASRGLDIPAIKNIIHYHIPLSQDAFVHRNGRTARMNCEGSAFVMADGSNDRTPDYIKEIPEIFPVNLSAKKPPTPLFKSVYIGLGKKDKLSKVDIVGFLCQKGGLAKSDIGVIELKDFHSFAAVKFELADKIVKRVAKEKIKGKSTKIEISK